MDTSAWTSFLKSIASFNGDLSSLTAPPFILSGTSLTEFSAYWSAHPDLLAAAAHEKDAKKRAQLVLKWFVSTLKQQYAARSEKYGNEKKPLNPFLGELFLGQWIDKAGTTELISEQVSHHPPATAYCITNKETGVRLQGYNAQKATFTKTINVRQIGHAVLTIPKSATGPSEDETYVITLPALHIEGLLFGSPFVELEGTSFITSSTGLTAKVDYSGRGWLSGKKNSVTATLYPSDANEKAAIANITGQWTKTFEMYSGPAKTNSSKTLLWSFDADAVPTTALTIADLDKQHPLESRRAWNKVATAITNGEMDVVGTEKTKIEQAQRDLRTKEKADGKPWERRYFTAQESCPVLDKLAETAGLPKDGEKDRTGGLWRFDEAKATAVAAEVLTPEKVKAIKAEVLGQTE